MRLQWRNSEFHLPPSDLGALIAAAPTSRDRLIISLFAYTGMRRAELADLRVEDIDIPRHRILVRNGKGQKQRFVFFPSWLVESLKKQAAGQDNEKALFPGRGGGHLSLRAVNKIVARIGQIAGIKNPNPKYRNITPHLLRHSFARNWKNAGASLESLQKLLGHASFSTTMDVYGTEDFIQTAENYSTAADRLVLRRQGKAAVPRKCTRKVRALKQPHRQATDQK